MEKRVTIAVATFNSLDYTKFFLDNLKRNVRFPYELVIVDNNSTDGTKEFLERLTDATVILNKRNLGFGQANNQAFARCKTEYFLGVNNDTVIFPGFIEQLVSFSDSHPKYGELGVHSNCIGAKDPVTKEEINKSLKELGKQGESPFEAFNKYFPDQRQFYEQFKKTNRKMKNIKVPPNFIGGWCFLVKRKIIKKIGGLFDKRFRVGFWEDVDLSWRIAKEGLKVGLLMDAYIHHFTHVSFNSSKDKLRKSDHTISRINALEFAYKWSDEIRIFLKREFGKERTLKQIMAKNLIIKVYFNRADKELLNVETVLKKEFVENNEVNFKDFLLRNKRKK